MFISLAQSNLRTGDTKKTPKSFYDKWLRFPEDGYSIVCFLFGILYYSLFSCFFFNRKNFFDQRSFKREVLCFILRMANP